MTDLDLGENILELENDTKVVWDPKWRIRLAPGFDYVGLEKRPNWWFRLWFRLMLGWRWERM